MFQVLPLSDDAIHRFWLITKMLKYLPTYIHFLRCADGLRVWQRQEKDRTSVNKMRCCQIDFNEWEWNVSTLNEKKWRRFQWIGNKNLANTTIPVWKARCDNNRLDGGNKANRNYNPMQMMTHCVHIHVNITESQGNTLDGHTAIWHRESHLLRLCPFLLIHKKIHIIHDNQFENLSFKNIKCISVRWRTQSLIKSENQYGWNMDSFFSRLFNFLICTIQIA